MAQEWKDLTRILIDDLFFICVHSIALNPEKFDMADVENYPYSKLVDKNGKLKYSNDFNFN